MTIYIVTERYARKGEPHGSDCQRWVCANEEVACQWVAQRRAHADDELVQARRERLGIACVSWETMDYKVITEDSVLDAGWF